MATPAQAAAATVGAGSLAAAGAYGITQAVNGGGEETTEEQESTSDTEIPTPVTFKDNESFAETSYNTKLISLIKTTNLPYLVKPDNNEKWWDWAFTNKYSKLKEGKQSHSVFASVTNSETLKTACQQAYTQNKEAYKFEDDYLLQNISDYCTKGEATFDISEPKADVYTSVDSTADFKNGVLSILENAKVLVKKDKGTNNDLWWKWAYEKLYKGKSSDLDTLFQTSKVTGGFDESNTNTLSNACNEAYKKDYAALKATNNQLLKNIKQFCSTDRTQTELKLPEPKLAETDLLSKDESSYSSHELVKKNDKILVDPKKAQDWWNWVFENVFSPFKTKNSTKLKAPFDDSKITAGYSEVTDVASVGEVTSLNKACLEAYKKQSGELGEVTTENKNLIDLVKTFCVPSSKGNLTKPA